MKRVIQRQSMLTGEWVDVMELYPEADEAAWLQHFGRVFTNLRVRYTIGVAA